MIELLLQAERALSVGLLDRAETLYRQVATADPRNSIAVVGLARVTLDRGDELAALDLARNALTIDPENVAAQRMIARLEEVIDYRGAAAEAAIAEMDAEAAAGVFGAVRDGAQAAPPTSTASGAEPEAATGGHVQEAGHAAAAEAAERDAEAEAAEHVAELPEPAPNISDAGTLAAESQPPRPDEPEPIPEPEAPPDRGRRRSLVSWLFRRR
jgi:tetratricopeptide (TPR) repeat protein